MSAFRLAVKDVLCRGPLRLHNALRNRRCTAGERMLVVQNPIKQRSMTRDFLAWVEKHVPELRERMEFCLLPGRVRDWSRYRVAAFWGGDVLVELAPWMYRHAQRFSDECQRRGIGVINPAQHWPNTGKSRAAGLIAACGFRTPKMHLIQDVDEFTRHRGGLNLPLLVREDRCHGQRSLLVTSHSQLRNVPWHSFRRPIAVEFIDTFCPHDECYRKYRYIALGSTGISRHLMFDRHWEVREERVSDEAHRAEEVAFISRPNRHHAAFQRARKALGLEIVAFDYSYDHDGEVVIWEPNPFPDINYPKHHLSRHIDPGVERTYAALARLYLRRGGWPVPGMIEDLLKGVPDDGNAWESPQRRAA